MSKRPSYRLLALLMAAVLVLTMIPTASAADPVIQVKIEPETLIMTVGEKKTLKATVMQDDKPIPGAVVTFTSLEPTKVKVDKNTGELEALSQGEDVKIQAVYQPQGGAEQYQAVCLVTVNPSATVKSVLVSPVKVEMEMRDTRATLTANVIPSDAADRRVTWTSETEGVVRINPTGAENQYLEMFPIAPGQTQIHASAGGVKSTKVTVEVSGLTLPGTKELLVGKNETLSLGRFGKADKGTVEWTSSDISVAEVKEGYVSAYNPGTTEIVAKVGSYKASCIVTVKENTANDVTEQMGAGESLSFQKVQGMLQYNFMSATGMSLEYVTNLNVKTSQGILYYGYTSPDVPGSGVAGSEKYYIHPGTSQQDLREITFIPASGFGGEAIIYYTGFGSGQSLTGRIRVHVENSGAISYHTADIRPLTFEVEDFVEDCKAKTGKTLRSVRFQLPPASQGTLYYQYSPIGQYSQKVTPSTEYGISGSGRLLEEVSFLPAKGYSGTVKFSYYGTDNANGGYTGQIAIQVTSEAKPGESGGGSSRITYTCTPGSKVRFDEDDFQQACLDATGSTLDYIYLTQPSAADGKLYYNYTNSSSYESVVSESQRYFRRSTPRIAIVDFVAASSFRDTVTIPYTGYSSSGKQFQGEIVIRGSGATGKLHYSTSAGQPARFSGRDFNEACQSGGGGSLDGIRFDLPPASQGTLYTNYRNAGNKGSKVSSGSWYSKSRLDDVSFVPASGFSGDAVISFTGRDEWGGQFSGQVTVTVDGTALSDKISYSIRSGGEALFQEDDFDRVSRALTGESLDYVRFTLPASSAGKLYYRYDSSKGKGTSVSSSTSYYRGGSSRQLDDVSFVADRSYSGTVSIYYTGRSTGGTSFEGVVTVQVSSSSMDRVYYVTGSLPVPFKASGFQTACSQVLPGKLESIELRSLPASYYGKLLVDYTRPNTGKPAVQGNRYYVDSLPLIDSLTFIPKAGFQGTATILYTAYDNRGNQANGTVEILVSGQNATSPFTDLGGYGWAAPSIEYLHHEGVVNGYSETTFGPAGQTSRGAFVLMLCRLFRFPPTSGQGFRDVPKGSPYEAAVVTAKNLGIVSGDNGYFRPTDPVTRQQAVVMLERAMTAAGWTVPASSPAVVDTYADGSQVSGYARSAMASMIRMGILQGDKSNRLNPQKPITRAEMAVILHRVLTY